MQVIVVFISSSEALPITNVFLSGVFSGREDSWKEFSTSPCKSHLTVKSRGKL
jgi:hypothetical protein